MKIRLYKLGENRKDIDLSIKKCDFKKFDLLLKKAGYVYYPYANPHHFYFLYDGKLTFLDVITTFKRKVKDNPFYKLRRMASKFGRGKLIVFVGPDGCGKTTLSNSFLDAIESFPEKKIKIYFGSRKGNRFYRIFDLIKKIAKVRINILLGRIIVTDRYIYLTLRKSFLKKIIRSIAPKPSLIFFLETNSKIILKRKQELNEKQINELNNLFKGIKNVNAINVENSIQECTTEMAKKFLNLYKNG
jgi:thymidylate kinase